MNWKKILLTIPAVLALVLAIWLWPVYQFYAHKDGWPISLFGWLDMPTDAPGIQQLMDSRYAQAGDRAIQILIDYRSSIGVPAVSAAVAIDGEIVWAGAAGWADLKTAKPATPETVFRIGSTSKALTATALGRMVDQELIDIDAPISSYLVELPNPVWADITARQLASHMAGIPHYADNRDWSGLYQTVALRRHYPDVRDAVSLFDGSPLLFSPGTDFEYSSLGTVLLGAVMSGAAGKPYRQLMQEQVFDPLDMTSTLVAPKRAQPDAALATFYYRRNDRYREWRPVDLSHRLPGGGFASTPSDLVRLGAAQLDESYIAAATRNEFWTPQVLASGEVNEQGYGLGWRWREWDIENVGLVRNANHGGVSRGSQSWLLVFPDYNMAIAFMINTRTDSFHEFGHRLYEELFRAFAMSL